MQANLFDFAPQPHIEGLGIPYMGSKRKLAKRINDFILGRHPECRYFYDLFGGGGAISFDAVQRPQLERVHYNELNTAIVELIKKIRDDGVTPEFYRWVSREEFARIGEGADWRAGLVQTCWSFGNNYEKGYLYGADIEPIKRQAHEFCADGIPLPDGTDIASRDVSERRLFLCDYYRAVHLERLQQLEALTRIQHLQNLQNLQNLQLSSLDYKAVPIDTPPDQTIIYLDPPYAGTAKYKKGVCHDELLDWILASPYTIYVSSYEFDGLQEVAAFSHRSTLSATANNKVTERLFCNR